MAISFLRLSKVSRKKFTSFSLEVFFLFAGGLMWHKMPLFVSTGLWIPTFMLIVSFFDRVCVCVCVWQHKWRSTRLGVCLRVCSWRCGDGVQVLHQALQVGHLLCQLVWLVALRERNRVTAGGGGGTGGKGGKHLEGGGEERRGKEERRGSVRDLSQRKGKLYEWDEASWAMEVRGTDVMKATSIKRNNKNKRESHQQPIKN